MRSCSWSKGSAVEFPYSPRCKHRAHILGNCSPGAYQACPRHLTAQAIALADAQEPQVFINAWNELVEGAVLSRMSTAAIGSWKPRTWLRRGFGRSLVRKGSQVDTATTNLLMTGEDDVERSEPFQSHARRSYSMDEWFTDEQLAGLNATYCGPFELAPLSIATVRDFCDRFDHPHSIARAS